MCGVKSVDVQRAPKVAQQSADRRLERRTPEAKRDRFGWPEVDASRSPPARATWELGADLQAGQSTRACPMSAGSNMKFGACAPLGAAVKPQVAQRTVQILLVEDDNAHAELTRRALVECRVLNQLESTTSGEAAIQRLRDPRQTLPDLVLLDTSLPGISGLKVLEAIRNEPRTAHLPVIMLTDAHDEATISAGYRADVKSFITKPVTAGGFREALQGIESCRRAA